MAWFLESANNSVREHLFHIHINPPKVWLPSHLTHIPNSISSALKQVLDNWEPPLELRALWNLFILFNLQRVQTCHPALPIPSLRIKAFFGSSYPHSCLLCFPTKEVCGVLGPSVGKCKESPLLSKVVVPMSVTTPHLIKTNPRFILEHLPSP